MCLTCNTFSFLEGNKEEHVDRDLLLYLPTKLLIYYLKNTLSAPKSKFFKVSKLSK